MKWLKRTWLSIVRRPLKSFLLFLVVFVMVNLLAGSLSIITTSGIIKKELEIGIGAEAIISPIYYGNAEVEQFFDEYDKVIQELCQQEYVEYGEYKYYSSGYIQYGEQQRYVDLSSTNIVDQKLIRDGEIKIKNTFDSRNFTQEEIDNGEMVVLINKNFGLDNDGFSTGFTEIGSTLTLNYSFKDDNGNQFVYPFEVKVIGTFQSSTHSSSMYIPTKAFMKVMEDANQFALENKCDPDYYWIGYANFKLNDTAYLDEFDALAAEKLVNLSDLFEYSSSSEIYERSAGPVENLDSIAKIIFVVSVIATILILGMVIVFFISDRQKEIGIYASLGERKKNLVLQILCEIILVSLLATSCASLSGLVLGNKLSDYMLEVQRYTKRQQDLGPLAQLPVIYKPVDSVLNSYDRDSVINCYETQPTVEYFSLLFVIASGTVLISCIVPMVYLTHLKPKEIMI